ncbi:hypothetical protein HELRODRAFT_172218 [Helobdella robusta]|uniref:Uncharacterized protein n=1 Tax=Helobdella robusta TaxID=6412 RepID=T1F554_HELRO|nr:hypothetical protein HELRODRAFT_172218 [Helobdella robusta]ESO04562.1 hypothetical protein HELRODRAFT_172218 [Helobdella robusta]
MTSENSENSLKDDLERSNDGSETRHEGFTDDHNKEDYKNDGTASSDNKNSCNNNRSDDVNNDDNDDVDNGCEYETYLLNNSATRATPSQDDPQLIPRGYRGGPAQFAGTELRMDGMRMKMNEDIQDIRFAPSSSPQRDNAYNVKFCGGGCGSNSCRPVSGVRAVQPLGGANDFENNINQIYDGQSRGPNQNCYRYGTDFDLLSRYGNGLDSSIAPRDLRGKLDRCAVGTSKDDPLPANSKMADLDGLTKSADNVKEASEDPEQQKLKLPVPNTIFGSIPRPAFLASIFGSSSSSNRDNNNDSANKNENKNNSDEKNKEECKANKKRKRKSSSSSSKGLTKKSLKAKKSASKIKTKPQAAPRRSSRIKAKTEKKLQKEEDDDGIRYRLNKPSSKTLQRPKSTKIKISNKKSTCSKAKVGEKIKSVTKVNKVTKTKATAKQCKSKKSPMRKRKRSSISSSKGNASVSFTKHRAKKQKLADSAKDCCCRGHVCYRKDSELKSKPSIKKKSAASTGKKCNKSTNNTPNIFVANLKKSVIDDDDKIRYRLARVPRSQTNANVSNKKSQSKIVKHSAPKSAVKQKGSKTVSVSKNVSTMKQPAKSKARSALKSKTKTSAMKSTSQVARISKKASSAVKTENAEKNTAYKRKNFLTVSDNNKTSSSAKKKKLDEKSKSKNGSDRNVCNVKSGALNAINAGSNTNNNAKIFKILKNKVDSVGRNPKKVTKLPLTYQTRLNKPVIKQPTRQISKRSQKRQPTKSKSAAKTNDKIFPRRASKKSRSTATSSKVAKRSNSVSMSSKSSKKSKLVKDSAAGSGLVVKRGVKGTTGRAKRENKSAILTAKKSQSGQAKPKKSSKSGSKIIIRSTTKKETFTKSKSQNGRSKTTSSKVCASKAKKETVKKDLKRKKVSSLTRSAKKSKSKKRPSPSATKKEKIVKRKISPSKSPCPAKRARKSREDVVETSNESHSSTTSNDPLAAGDKNSSNSKTNNDDKKDAKTKENESKDQPGCSFDCLSHRPRSTIRLESLVKKAKLIVPSVEEATKGGKPRMVPTMDDKEGEDRQKSRTTAAKIRGTTSKSSASSKTAKTDSKVKTIASKKSAAVVKPKKIATVKGRDNSAAKPKSAAKKQVKTAAVKKSGAKTVARAAKISKRKYVRAN